MTATAASSERRAARRGAADAATQRYANRELSWLDFDRRVLELAADDRLPLLERVRLCAIVSSNLDEFFAVRVSRLRRLVDVDARGRSPDGRTPAETLGEIRRKVLELQTTQDALWLESLQPALARKRIRVVTARGATEADLRALQKRFVRELEPLLTPIAVGAAAPFPHVESRGLSLAVAVRDTATGERGFMRVNVPPGRRFIAGGRRCWMAAEELIALNLDRQLGGKSVEAVVPFRAIRSAELTLSEDAEELLEAVEQQVELRRFANVARLEVPVTAPARVVEWLRRELGVERDQVYRSAAPLGLASLHELASLDRPELTYDAWRPVNPRAFVQPTPADLLARIRRRDVLVQHPYESFDQSVQAFVDAARDPKVAALKATVYRTGDPSPTLASLVHTAEEGKQAVCLVELLARFDERHNIDWSRALQRAGVDVVHGLADSKVHAKLMLLVREEKNGPRRYVHIGTGNYHHSNAVAYEDVSLFTADDEIGADVAQVFNCVTAGIRPAGFHKLLVAPWFLRDGLLREIEEVEAAVRSGEAGRIRIKVNSFADPEIAEALYRASQAGVDVELLVRGICTVRAGVPGLSERIRVRSVLGRFLEHSRIYVFQAGDRTRYWLGSPDLAPRNLDRRIETLAPVEDSRLRAQIGRMLDALWGDTASSWELRSDDRWHRVRSSGKPSSAQEAFMAHARRRSAKRRR
jgi:polyphosphate kinase